MLTKDDITSIPDLLQSLAVAVHRVWTVGGLLGTFGSLSLTRSDEARGFRTALDARKAEVRDLHREVALLRAAAQRQTTPYGRALDNAGHYRWERDQLRSGRAAFGLRRVFPQERLPPTQGAIRKTHMEPTLERPTDQPSPRGCRVAASACPAWRSWKNCRLRSLFIRSIVPQTPSACGSGPTGSSNDPSR